MNEREVAELISIVRTLYPAQRFDDNPQNVMRAWALVVADLQIDEARRAVVRLARRGQQWCAPGDVRRECAAGRNVLAPSADEMLSELREVARRQGVGRRALHPVARDVYDAQGGADAIRRLDARGLQQLRRALVEASTTHDQRMLEADELPAARPALQSGVRQEIEPGE